MKSGLRSLDEIRQPVNAVMLSFAFGSLFTIFILGVSNFFINEDTELTLISFDNGVLLVHNEGFMTLLFSFGLVFTYIPIIILVVVLLCKSKAQQNMNSESGN